MSFELPEDALSFTFLAASGPGGQNVNKVATACQLRCDVFRLGLAPDVYQRLKQLAGSRMTAGGEIVITARQHRTQEANREAFRADEAGYLDRFALTPEQRTAVLERDWIRMLELGGNIYYTFKLAACDGMTFQQLAAKQTGVTEEEYLGMMLSGGRSIEGNRSRADRDATEEHAHG